MMLFITYTIFVDSVEVMKRYLKGKVDTIIVNVDKRIKDLVKQNKLPPFIREKLAFYTDGETSVLIDDIKGKHLPITFMVVFNKEGSVKAVEILIYREEYGWEIKDERFLSQLKGKDINPEKIRNIPGATISVRAITLGVKRALLIYNYLFGR